MILRYKSALNNRGTLEVDLNFLYRVPLLGAELKSSYFWLKEIHNIPVLTFYELAAGKLNALFNRTVARDLFDTYSILQNEGFDIRHFRAIFIVYIAMGRKSWREMYMENITMDFSDLQRNLLPVLRNDHISNFSRPIVTTWAKQMVDFCQQQLKDLVNFDEKEQEFLSKIQEEGLIMPELITEDASFAERIMYHPALQWRAKNAQHIVLAE
jgi:hypothetical protein